MIAVAVGDCGSRAGQYGCCSTVVLAFKSGSQSLAQDLFDGGPFGFGNLGKGLKLHGLVAVVAYALIQVSKQLHLWHLVFAASCALCQR